MAERVADSEWRRWLESWEEQQAAGAPRREERFDAMLDVLEARLPRRFVALDVGSGPGSLSHRILRRFPRARAIAVDRDPVLLHLGRKALGTMGGRLTWVETDLRSPTWRSRLPVRKVDAAVSTTALHWFTARELRRVYRDLGQVVRRGGLLLDGDWIPYPQTERALREIALEVDRRRCPSRQGGRTRAWDAWWKAAERVSDLRPFFQERAALPPTHHSEEELPLAVHVSALKAAGFREADVVWQHWDNRILAAVR